MNLVLFEPAEIDQPLPRSDRRAVHVLEVLRRREGDTFDAGIVDGSRGKGQVHAIDQTTLTFEFSATSESPPLVPITLIVGLPRPQTARNVLREASTLGVAALHFVTTDKGEPNYAQSTLWSSGEWRRHVLAGVEQAFATRIPQVTHGRSLTETLATLSAATARCALDNYESAQALSQTGFVTHDVVLALGAERGWSDAEREQLRARGFVFAHLGERVLRTETACVAAITLVKAKLGLM